MDNIELRDYFAAQALKGCISADPKVLLAYLSTREDPKNIKISQIAYEMADEMMKEREREKNDTENGRDQ